MASDTPGGRAHARRMARIRARNDQVRAERRELARALRERLQAPGADVAALAAEFDITPQEVREFQDRIELGVDDSVLAAIFDPLWRDPDPDSN